MRRGHSRTRSASPPGRSAEDRAPAPETVGRPLAWTHPATIVVYLTAAACVLAAVTFHILDTDFWQHLAVARSLWESRTLPHTELWAWPNWGEPAVLRSWLFRVMLWPFWQVGGLTGLYVWRWLTTIAVFGLILATARRMGARGFTPAVVLVLCSLVYRQRSQVRPETLAAVLLALTLWLLESRRNRAEAAGRGLDRTWWLVAVMWVWVNAHISFLLGFLVIGIHLVDAHVAAWRGRRGAGPAGLWAVTFACVVVAFLNPYGGPWVWQPFDYLLHWRKTAPFQGIGELRPVGWGGNVTSGVFVLLPVWPLLLLWRARRQGLDVAGILTCAAFTAYALPSQRFLGAYAVAAAPYVARDLDLCVASRRWPRWTGRPVARAALAIAACLAVVAPEFARRDSPMRPGVGLVMTRYPVGACDFIATHGLRGRLFNQARTSGYLLWRFWPDRGRLPFVSIHPEDSPPDIRGIYAAVLSDPRVWAEADARFRFDMILLERRRYGADRFYAQVDRDSTWALVFADDAALLYLRREGPLAGAARRLAYRAVPGDQDALLALRVDWASDEALRRAARAELERQAAASRYNAGASSLLADLAMADGRFPEARALLEHALAVDPGTPRVHERLGLVALWQEDHARAATELERERRISGPSAGLEVTMGFAREAAGDRAGARAHYLQALRLEPGHARARELLQALDRAP